jgi:hypothetical protein
MDGPKRAQVDLSPDIKIVVTNASGEQYEDKIDSSYTLGTEIAYAETKYSSKCPLSDSVLEHTHPRELYNNQKAFGIRNVSAVNGDAFAPISNYTYSISDTAIAEIGLIYPTLVPESHFGKISFKAKKDGQTVLMGISKSGKDTLCAPVIVKDMTVMNSGLPLPKLKKYSTGFCNCKQ